MHGQNLKHVLKAFANIGSSRLVRGVWFFPLLLAIGLIGLTALRISGSSIGMFYSSLYGNVDQDPNLLLNAPRSIRSDEWEVNTPLILSQAANDYPRVNPDIGNGQDMSVVLDTPYKEWSTIFKPQHWAFFALPVEYAFAFKWWLLAMLLMLGCYAFTLTLLPRRYLLASLISVAVFLSPFVQWWYQSMTILPLAYGLFIGAVGLRLFDKGLGKRTLLGLSALLTFLLICFAFILYVPFLVPTGLVVGAVLIGHIVNLLQRPKDRPFTIRRLAYIVVPAVITLGVTAVFVSTRSDTIHAISNSVYPGHRTEPSGGFSFRHLAGGYFNAQLQRSATAMHLPLNQSEASSFILLFPFLAPALLYAMLRKKHQKREIDWRIVGLLAVLALFLARMFLPFTDPIFSAMQLDRVPHTRMLIGFGLLNSMFTVLALRYLSHMRDDVSLGVRWWSTIAAFVGVSWLGLNMRATYPGYIGSGAKVLLVGAGVALIVWLVLKKRFVLAMGLFVLYSLVSTAGVNPLYRGLDPILDSKISQAIRSTGDKQGAWVVGNNAEFLENVTLAQGVRSLSGVYAYPQLDVWKPLGTGPQQVAVYNRFAHVFFTVEDINKPNLPADAYLDPPALDAFRVHADPCSSFFKERRVRYVVAATVPTGTCLTPIKQVIYPAITLTIYEITEH